MTPPSDPPSISVVIADAYPLYSNGVAAALALVPDIAVLGTAADGPGALEMISSRLPQVAVVDLDLPGHDVRDIMRLLRARYVPTAFVVVAERWPGEIVRECLKAGARSLVKRRITGPDLVAAIRQAAAGHSVLPREVGPDMTITLRQQGNGTHPALSVRERQVLSAISRGQSAASIAVELHLAEPTVKAHISNLYGKLGVHDRGAAVGAAIRRGVIE